MFIPRLQTRGVFACHCQILERSIKVGLLAVRHDADLEPSLLDPLSGKRYKVRVPDSDFEFNVELMRLDDE